MSASQNYINTKKKNPKCMKKKIHFTSLTAKHMSTSYMRLLYPKYWTQIGFQMMCDVSNCAHRP